MTDISPANFTFTDKLGNNGTTLSLSANDLAKLQKVVDDVYSLKMAHHRFVIASSPRWFRRDSLPSVNKTTITIPKGLQVNVDDNGLILNQDTTLNLNSSDAWDNSTYATAANRAGKDFYIYACLGTLTSPSNNIPDFILSANSTVPTGYTADTSRKIGGFHCLCLDVGTISGHTLSGYVTGDILPASVWDLLHRPVCDSEGMVYVDKLDKWVSIYLPSWDGSKLVSKFNGVIVDGGSSYPMDGEQFVEFAGDAKCYLPSRDEFKVFSEGSNQQTNILGSADPNTTGGHKDTNNRRMISNFGIEDCCGALWQWTRDIFEAMSTTWNNNNPWMEGYSWQTKSVVSTGGDTNRRERGSCAGLMRRALVGASWGAGASCGSRSVHCDAFGSRVSAYFSSRLVSDKRVVNI